MIDGSFATVPSKPQNMVMACRALEAQLTDPGRIGDRSLRVLIPRLLPFLYEIRNNRNVGHVGGEVNPNHADAEAVLGMANWIMAELVRIFHNVPLVEAQAAVDSLVERRHALIWQFEGAKRVLNTKMSKKDQTLALLYSESDWIEVERLRDWVEYSSLSGFKSNVLIPQHKERLLEFDSVRSRVKITPRGINHVEKNLLDREGGIMHSP